MKGKDPNLIIADLRHLLPSINFETFLTDRQNTKKETDFQQSNLNETEFISRSNVINCGEQFLHPWTENHYYTTEKLINTDEQCEFPPGERFPRLTDNELEEELRRFCTTFKWKDIKTVLGKSFAPLTHPQLTNTVISPSLSQTIKLLFFSIDIY
jgi:hypothetical protein